MWGSNMIVNILEIFFGFSILGNWCGNVGFVYGVIFEVVVD